MSARNMLSVFKRTRELGDQLHRDLGQVRDEVVRAADEVERIRRLPRAREEAEADIRRLVQAGAQSFDTYLGDFTKPNGAPFQQVANALNGSHGSIQRDTFGFMCAVSPAGMFEFLSRKLDDAYAAGPGLPTAQRASLLAKADARLLELSLAEEAIVRACEDAGMAVMRRPEADPRAVLAPASDLPN